MLGTRQGRVARRRPAGAATRTSGAPTAKRGRSWPIPSPGTPGKSARATAPISSMPRRSGCGCCRAGWRRWSTPSSLPVRQHRQPHHGQAPPPHDRPRRQGRLGAPPDHLISEAEAEPDGGDAALAALDVRRPRLALHIRARPREIEHAEAADAELHPVADAASRRSGRCAPGASRRANPPPGSNPAASGAPRRAGRAWARRHRLARGRGSPAGKGEARSNGPNSTCREALCSPMTKRAGCKLSSRCYGERHAIRLARPALEERMKQIAVARRGPGRDPARRRAGAAARGRPHPRADRRGAAIGLCAFGRQLRGDEGGGRCRRRRPGARPARAHAGRAGRGRCRACSRPAPTCRAARRCRRCGATAPASKRARRPMRTRPGRSPRPPSRGDRAAFLTRWGELRTTCGACHDTYRAPD